jgi:integrase
VSEGCQLDVGRERFPQGVGPCHGKAKVEVSTFHDLRGTAVTRLSEAECTPQEIATIAGHGLGEVQTIIDRYLKRTEKLAVAAIAKLERGRA